MLGALFVCLSDGSSGSGANPFDKSEFGVSPHPGPDFIGATPLPLGEVPGVRGYFQSRSGATRKLLVR